MPAREATDEDRMVATSRRITRFAFPALLDPRRPARGVAAPAAAASPLDPAQAQAGAGRRAGRRADHRRPAGTAARDDDHGPRRRLGRPRRARPAAAHGPPRRAAARAAAGASCRSTTRRGPPACRTCSTPPARARARQRQRARSASTASRPARTLRWSPPPGYARSTASSGWARRPTCPLPDRGGRQPRRAAEARRQPDQPLLRRHLDAVRTLEPRRRSRPRSVPT